MFANCLKIMQKITIFKNIFDVDNPLFVDVLEVLKRIKDGNSKAIVEKIRTSNDYNEKNEFKKRLPSICFSGRFGRREAEFLLEHSGLIILDVDNIDLKDIPKIKKEICSDLFTMACFISPSGNGLKILIKIAPDKNYHKGQFLALEKHFNKILHKYTSTRKNEKKRGDIIDKIDTRQGDYLLVHIDTSGKDINRVCYESYDPDIYWNDDSELWCEILEEKVVEKSLVDQEKIIQLLQVWIDKNEGYFEGNRNNYLSKFLYAMCRYGINEFKAKSYIANKFPGVPEKDLNSIAKSCYSKADFGTEQFTEKEMHAGKTSIDTKINASKPVTAFWEINDKGKVRIDSKQFLKFIATNGFGIYKRNSENERWHFIKISNMIVDIVSVLEIKQYVLDYVEKHAPEPVFDELQMKNRYFESTYLNALPLIEIEQIKDTVDASYIFFNNYYYEITAEKQVKKSYIDLGGKHIWRRQICKKNIEKIVDYKEHDFNKFILRAIGNDIDKYKMICSAIGYLCHTFKKKRLTKLIYSCDRGQGELDGMPMGGTGKELAFQCLYYVRSVTPIDGMVYDKRDKFNFQSVSEDTQIVMINDYVGDIKELFNKITGHFEVEKKQKDKIILDFENAPKLLVNSNNSPKGFANSFKRRLLTIEFSDHYSENYTPADEFGDKDFFLDWNQDDFNALYSFIFGCIQYYLKYGLFYKEIDMKANYYKQLCKNTSTDFAEYFYDNQQITEWASGRMLYNDYLNEAGENITFQEFYSRLRKMCNIYGWKFESNGKGNLKQIMINKTNNVIKPPQQQELDMF